MWQQSSDSIPSAGILRDELSCSIIWQGDPFSCSKTFGKLSCSNKLCQKERVVLLRHSWMDESNMLNDRSELHGSCRRTARFHWLFIKRNFLVCTALVGWLNSMVPCMSFLRCDLSPNIAYPLTGWPI
jgi:hypothetical protein